MTENMRVLVACEFSGVVRNAFEKQGHYAMSCDLLPTEIPGNHYQGDVRDVLYDDWDLLIAHPPCTRLCRQSQRWVESHEEVLDAVDLFCELRDAPIQKICIENPIPFRSVRELLGEYTQIVQPWQFGHDFSKRTGFWLKNLPKLKPTNIVQITYYVTPKGRKFTNGWYHTPRNSIDRSRTFTGIADAMATQWTNIDDGLDSWI